jgi:hypothetical protein
MNDELLVEDIIEPVTWLSYVIERTAQLSRFFTSGIVAADDQFAARADGPGSITNMPFWQDIKGRSQVLSDKDPLKTKKISASADVALIHNRGDAWSDNDLASILATGDPEAASDAVAELVAEYWARDHEATLFSMLKGIFAASSMAANSSDIYLASGSSFTDDNYLNAKSFIRGRGKLGDAAAKLTAVGMHSLVYQSLLENDLITVIKDSEGRDIEAYRNLPVIVDDSVTVETINSAPVFSTYLFGTGAVAFGVGRQNKPIKARPGSYWQLEFDRESLAHKNNMINRRRYVMHIRGVKWTGAVMEGLSPEDAEMEDGTNWERVFETKNVRVVRIRHNIPLV